MRLADQMKATPTDMASTTSVRTKHPWNRTLLATTIVAIVAIVVFPFSVAAAQAPVRAGDALVVDAYSRTQALTHGSAFTEFSVRLPDNSTCPGDSAHDQWRVQSFIIPADADPVAIRYGAIGPEPPGHGRYALFMLETTPFVHQLTRPNPGAGQPGVIQTMPPFNFTVVAGDGIPSGEYRVGAACTYFGKTAKYWDTQIVISGSGVTAGQLSWRLADVPDTVFTAGQGSGRSALANAALAAAGFGAVAVGVFVWRRRGRHVTTLSKEHS